jgi:hypothetical protein
MNWRQWLCLPCSISLPESGYSGGCTYNTNNLASKMIRNRGRLNKIVLCFEILMPKAAL